MPATSLRPGRPRAKSLPPPSTRHVEVVKQGADTAAAAPWQKPMRLPVELLLEVAHYLEPQAYLNLSQMNRFLRNALRDPGRVQRVVLYYEDSLYASHWEGRRAYPLWEQLVLQTNFAAHVRRTPWHGVLRNLDCKIIAISVGESGRFVAFMDSDREVRFWDVFKRQELHLLIHSNLVLTPGGEPEEVEHGDCDSSTRIELIGEYPLLLIECDCAWALWRMQGDCERPIFGRKKRAGRTVLAGGGRWFLHHDLYHFTLTAYDYATFRKEHPGERYFHTRWYGVRGFAAARYSDNLLLYGWNMRIERSREIIDHDGDYLAPRTQYEIDESVGDLQLWNLDEAHEACPQLIRGVPREHLSAEDEDWALESSYRLPTFQLHLSDCGTRAVHVIDKPVVKNADPRFNSKYVNRIEAWSLADDSDWSTTVYRDMHLDLKEGGRLSPDGRYWIAVTLRGTAMFYDLGAPQRVYALRSGTYGYAVLERRSWAQRAGNKSRATFDALVALLMGLLHKGVLQTLPRLRELPADTALDTPAGQELKRMLDNGVFVVAFEEDGAATTGSTQTTPSEKHTLSLRGWNKNTAVVCREAGWMATSSICGPVFCHPLASRERDWCGQPQCFRCDKQAEKEEWNRGYALSRWRETAPDVSPSRSPSPPSSPVYTG